MTIIKGTTWFDQRKRTFVDVPIDDHDGISTAEFLEAAESLVTIFDLLGPTLFLPVTSDMNGNIRKVRERYTATHPESASKATSEATTEATAEMSQVPDTLQQLCLKERKEGKSTATEGLLWLVRGLQFLAEAMRADLVANKGVSPTSTSPRQTLSASFKAAYNKTLYKYHGWAIRLLFSTLVGKTPTRDEFIPMLVGPSATAEESYEEMDKHIAAVEKTVAILNKFLASPEAKF